MVAWWTLKLRAISRTDSPSSRRLIASRCWCRVSLCGRPRLLPFAFARARPSEVRARISSRSNSARPPRTVGRARQPVEPRDGQQSSGSSAAITRRS